MQMKKKQLTWILAAAITLIGSLFLHGYLVNSNSFMGVVSLFAGCVLLYPSIKGWAEIIEPNQTGDEEEA